MCTQARRGDFSMATKSARPAAPKPLSAENQPQSGCAASSSSGLPSSVIAPSGLDQRQLEVGREALQLGRDAAVGAARRG